MVGIWKSLSLVTSPAPASDPAKSIDEEAQARALRTILELSALIGEPPVATAADAAAKQETSTVDQDSVAAWSANKLDFDSKALLAEPKKCPPFTDPSSVVIADPCSLEYELEEEDLMHSTHEEDSQHEPAAFSKGGSKVRFQCTVSIVEIPSHRDMDFDTIVRIWTSVDQVQENAMRNSMEFYADGRDWRSATEEDDMIFDYRTGEYVHPATWNQLQAELQRQAALEEEWHRLAAMEEAARQKRIRQQKARDAHRRNKARNKWLQKQQQQAAIAMQNHYASHGLSPTGFVHS